MLMLSLVKMAWEYIFKDLILIGKIFAFIPLACFSVLMIPSAILEFFVIDSIVFFVLLFSKELSPKDFMVFFDL